VHFRTEDYAPLHTLSPYLPGSCPAQRPGAAPRSCPLLAREEFLYGFKTGRQSGRSARRGRRVSLALLRRSRSAGRAWALTRKRPGSRLSTLTSSGAASLTRSGHTETCAGRDRSRPFTDLPRAGARRRGHHDRPLRAGGDLPVAPKPGYGAPVSWPDAGHPPKARDLHDAPRRSVATIWPHGPGDARRSHRADSYRPTSLRA